MALSDYQKRSVAIIFLTLIFGAVMGTILGELLTLVLPEGVVRQFFGQTFSWGLSPVTLDLLVANVTFGLRIKFSVTSLLGIGVAYYFLRYFR